MIPLCAGFHSQEGLLFSSRRRHMRWNCDWSSDVCSSDLALKECVSTQTWSPRFATFRLRGVGRLEPSTSSRTDREKPLPLAPTHYPFHIMPFNCLSKIFPTDFFNLNL